MCSLPPLWPELRLVGSAMSCVRLSVRDSRADTTITYAPTPGDGHLYYRPPVAEHAGARESLLGLRLRGGLPCVACLDPSNLFEPADALLQ